MSKRHMELLAPAGNMDKLKMAIRYGADAVYCAGRAFGLRAASSNFDNEQLKEAVEFVHSHGKKIYVTCNIIPHNEDLTGLEDYLKFLESIKVDAPSALPKTLCMNHQIGLEYIVHKGFVFSFLLLPYLLILHSTYQYIILVQLIWCLSSRNYSIHESHRNR